MEWETGRVVLAIAGRDKGKFFVVLGYDNQQVLIADGKSRKIENPKYKNEKHLQATRTVVPASSLATNREVKKALRSFLSQEGGC